MDEEMPSHNKIFAQDYGDVIFKVYQEVDKALGELLKNIDDKSVFIFSNTGMGPNYSARHLLPTVLARLGMDGAPWEKSKLRYFTRQLENWLRSRFVKWTKFWLPESWWEARQYQLENFRYNWKECSAFAVPNDHTGAIRINLKGREPLGIVEPGDSYEALCNELTTKLLQLVNPATGHKVVQEVILVRDVYQGERLNDLPDLIVKWRNDAPVFSLTSPIIGLVNGTLKDPRSGTHRKNAYYLRIGERVVQNMDDEISLLDIAPTILSILETPIPESYAGKVQAAFTGHGVR
jgi:predicted AlkP superfamily phosphohydrolase/phosphomutase